MEWVLIIVVSAVLIYIAITLIVAVNLLTRGRLRIKPVDDEKRIKRQLKKMRSTAEWAEQNQFLFVQFYEIFLSGQKMWAGIWQHEESPTYLTQYFIFAGDVLKSIYEFTSDFDYGMAVNTSASRDSVFFPKPPGIYVQTFPRFRKKLDELWMQHMEAEAYLLQNGAAWPSRIRGLEEQIAESVQRETRYVRSIPFWPFRGAWWYFVRRLQRSNLTIEQQVEKGYAVLPDELVQSVVEI